MRRLAAVTALIVAAAAAPPASAGFGWLSQFGSSGVAGGQFSDAHGIASDGQGNLYVADHGNARVQKFDSGGNFLRTWGWGVQDGSNAFQVCTSGCTAGLRGGGDGQFVYPVDVAVDAAGFVYVAEGHSSHGFNYPGNERIQKFDGDGNFVTKWGSGGPSEGYTANPRAVAVDGAGSVYVAETWNRRVSKFTSSGAFVRMWGWGVDDGSAALQVCTSDCQAGLEGYGDGQFLGLFGIAVAPNGQVHTLDNGSERVQRFSADGAFLGKFSVSEGGTNYYHWAIEVDAAGTVYVVKNFGPGPQTVKRFTADGVLQDRIECDTNLFGVGAHPSGNVYVSTSSDVRAFGEGGTGCAAPGAPPGGGGPGPGPGGDTSGLTFVGNEGVTINDGARFTNDPDVVLRIVGPPGAVSVRMANDGGFAGATSRPIEGDQRYEWPLDRDPDRDERLPKTVYVRFTGPGGDSALTFTDDVILDTVPPSVSQASLSGGGAGSSSASASKARRFTLRLKARDANSGLARLQLAVTKRKPAKARAFKPRLTFRATKAPRFVRVSDRAGNFSKWRKLRAKR